MAASDYYYGYPTSYVDGELRFDDTGEPVTTTYKSRPCGHCGLMATPEGHDGCLGALPGVMNACCGHGGKSTNKPYVQFRDGTDLTGDEAIREIRRLKNDNDH